jgi:two-component system sensor histidine kinase KdpD
VTGAPGPAAAPSAQVELQRSALLRSVTHDLRTPLAAIRAIVTDLFAGTDYDDTTRSELLQTVCDEVDRLDRLVGNLLSMSRIEAGVLEPEHQAIDVAELVRHRIGVLAALLRDFTVVADIEPGLPLADGDYGQLEEVLTNLLGNAARHAPAGSRIEVRARELPIDIAAGLAFVAISVVDHGPGIDPAARERVFEAFQRGPGSRSTGLGLAICQAIVKLHGGTIRIDETPGGGATVVFTVPVRRSIDEHEPATMVADHGGDREGGAA